MNMDVLDRFKTKLHTREVLLASCVVLLVLEFSHGALTSSINPSKSGYSYQVGEEVRFDCVFPSASYVRILWKKSNASVEEEDVYSFRGSGSGNHDPQGSLRFRNVTGEKTATSLSFTIPNIIPTDNGQYRCEAEIFGEDPSFSQKVNLSIRISPSSVQIHNVDGDANLYLDEGNVTLIAKVSCTRPQPNLQWRLQGGSVLESTTRSCSKDKCGDKKDDNYAECTYTLDTSVTEAQHEKSLQVIVTGQAIAGSLLANATIRINGTTTTPPPGKEGDNVSTAGLGPGALAGIIIVILAIIVFAVIGTIFYLKKRQEPGGGGVTEMAPATNYAFDPENGTGSRPPMTGGEDVTTGSAGTPIQDQKSPALRASVNGQEQFMNNNTPQGGTTGGGNLTGMSVARNPLYQNLRSQDQNDHPYENVGSMI